MPTNNYTKEQIKQLILSKSKQYGVDPKLASVIAKNESSYRQNATSRDKEGRPVAYGVMQLTPPTAAKYGLSKDKLYDAEANIDAGVRMLKELSNKYQGRVDYIAGAYHAGPGAVDPKTGPIRRKGYGPKTANYTSKIMRDFQGQTNTGNVSLVASPTATQGRVPSQSPTTSTTTTPTNTGELSKSDFDSLLAEAESLINSPNTATTATPSPNMTAQAKMPTPTKQQNQNQGQAKTGGVDWSKIKIDSAKNKAFTSSMAPQAPAQISRDVQAMSRQGQTPQPQAQGQTTNTQEGGFLSRGVPGLLDDAIEVGKGVLSVPGAAGVLSGLLIKSPTDFANVDRFRREIEYGQDPRYQIGKTVGNIASNIGAGVAGGVPGMVAYGGIQALESNLLDQANRNPDQPFSFGEAAKETVKGGVKAGILGKLGQYTPVNSIVSRIAGNTGAGTGRAIAANIAKSGLNAGENVITGGAVDVGIDALADVGENLLGNENPQNLARNRYLDPTTRASAIGTDLVLGSFVPQGLNIGKSIGAYKRGGIQEGIRTLATGEAPRTVLRDPQPQQTQPLENVQTGELGGFDPALTIPKLNDIYGTSPLNRITNRELGTNPITEQQYTRDLADGSLIPNNVVNSVRQAETLGLGFKPPSVTQEMMPIAAKPQDLPVRPTQEIASPAQPAMPFRLASPNTQEMIPGSMPANKPAPVGVENLTAEDIAIIKEVEKLTAGDVAKTEKPTANGEEIAPVNQPVNQPTATGILPPAFRPPSESGLPAMDNPPQGSTAGLSPSQAQQQVNRFSPFNTRDVSQAFNNIRVDPGDNALDLASRIEQNIRPVTRNMAYEYPPAPTTKPIENTQLENIAARMSDPDSAPTMRQSPEKEAKTLKQKQPTPNKYDNFREDRVFKPPAFAIGTETGNLRTNPPVVNKTLQERNKILGRLTPEEAVKKENQTGPLTNKDVNLVFKGFGEGRRMVSEDTKAYNKREDRDIKKFLTYFTADEGKTSTMGGEGAEPITNYLKQLREARRQRPIAVEPKALAMSSPVKPFNRIIKADKSALPVATEKPAPRSITELKQAIGGGQKLSTQEMEILKKALSSKKKEIAPAPVATEKPVEAEKAALPSRPLPVEAEKVKEKLPTKVKSLSDGYTSELASPYLDNVVKSRFKLVNIDDLITSHDNLLNKNAVFPKELQPRDRGRNIAALIGEKGIIPAFKPQLLGDAGIPSQGAPIVGNDNIVESGNKRIIAMRTMYDGNNKKQIQEYKTWLRSNAKKFGIDPKQITDDGRVVMIRERETALTPEERVKFTRIANESDIEEYNPVERAMVDAEALDMAKLDKIGGTGDLLANENAKFIEDFVNKVAAPANRGKLIKDGELTQSGLRRVQNAMFIKAFGDDPETVRILSDITESTRADYKNIANALVSKAPRIAQIRAKSTDNASYDISPDIMIALNKYANLRKTRMSADDYIKQEAIEGTKLNENQQQLLRLLDASKRDGSLLKNSLDKYLDIAQKEVNENANQNSMFGGLGPQKDDVVKDVVKEAFSVVQRKKALAAEKRAAKAKKELKKAGKSGDIIGKIFSEEGSITLGPGPGGQGGRAFFNPKTFGVAKEFAVSKFEALGRKFAAGSAEHLEAFKKSIEQSFGSNIKPYINDLYKFANDPSKDLKTPVDFQPMNSTNKIVNTPANQQKLPGMNKPPTKQPLPSSTLAPFKTGQNLNNANQQNLPGMTSPQKQPLPASTVAPFKTGQNLKNAQQQNLPGMTPANKTAPLPPTNSFRSGNTGQPPMQQQNLPGMTQNLPAKADGDPWLKTLSSHIKANMLTRPASAIGDLIGTNLRNVGKNVISDPIRGAVDKALSKLPAVEETTPGTFQPRNKERTFVASKGSVVSNVKKAITEGVPNAVKIATKKGLTPEQLAEVEAHEIKSKEAKTPGLKNVINPLLKLEDKYINAVGRARSALDSPGYEYALNDAIESSLRTRAKNTGQSVDQLRQAVERVKAQGQNYNPNDKWAKDLIEEATKEANYQTLRDDNFLSEKLSKFKANLWKGDKSKQIAAFVLDQAAPFARTQSNILRQASDATVGGIFKGGRAIARSVKRGGLTKQDQSQIARSAGDVALGATAIGAGATLASKGLAERNISFNPFSGEDKEEKELNRAANRPAGAIRIGKRAVTPHWLGTLKPVFEFGVAIQKALSNKEKTGEEKAKAVFDQIINSALDNPISTGARDIAAAAFGDEKKQSLRREVIKRAGVGAVPLGVSDLAAPVNKALTGKAATERLPKIEGKDLKEDLKEEIFNRIPYFREKKGTPRYTALGDLNEIPLLQAIDPFRSKEERRTPVTQELTKINVGLSPLQRDKKTESPEQFAQRQELVGKFTNKQLTALVEDGFYKTLNKRKEKTPLDTFSERQLKEKLVKGTEQESHAGQLSIPAKVFVNLLKSEAKKPLGDIKKNIKNKKIEGFLGRK